MRYLQYTLFFCSLIVLACVVWSSPVLAQYRPSIPNVIYEGSSLIIDCVNCGSSSEKTQAVNWSPNGSTVNSVTPKEDVTIAYDTAYEMHKITIKNAEAKGIKTETYVQVCASTGCTDIRKINALSTNTPGYDRSAPEALTPTPFSCSLVLSRDGQEVADSSRGPSVAFSTDVVVDASLIVTASGQPLPNSLPIIDFGGTAADATNKLTMNKVEGTNKFEVKGKSLANIGYRTITVEYPFCLTKPTVYVLSATPTPTVAVQPTISGTTWNAASRNELTVTGSNLDKTWNLYANPGGSEDLDVKIIVSSWTAEAAHVDVAQNPNKFLDTGNYLRVCKDRKTNCSGYIVISQRPAELVVVLEATTNTEYTVSVQISSAYNTEQEAKNAIVSGEWNTKSVTYSVRDTKIQNPGSILFFDSRFGGRVYWDRKEGNSLCVRYISNKPDRWHIICKPLVTPGSVQSTPANPVGAQSSSCPEGFVPGCEPGRCVLNIGEFSCGDKGFRCVDRVPVCNN